jgi:7-carboxy-7-deazaguanine synthase
MKINEIFTSIDGEVNKWGQGALTTFVRLQGCNLRCLYCDTPDAITFVNEIGEMPIASILSQVSSLQCTKVTITGGEPLAQPEIFNLIDLLMRYEYNISVETNGTFVIPIPYLNDERLNWVVDYKLECEEKMKVNYLALTPTDWIKFIVHGEKSFKMSLQVVEKLRKDGCGARIAFSTTTDPKNLMDRLIEAKAWDIVLNVQLHKLLDVK